MFFAIDEKPTASIINVKFIWTREQIEVIINWKAEKQIALQNKKKKTLTMHSAHTGCCGAASLADYNFIICFIFFKET